MKLGTFIYPFIFKTCISLISSSVYPCSCKYLFINRRSLAILKKKFMFTNHSIDDQKNEIVGY